LKIPNNLFKVQGVLEQTTSTVDSTHYTKAIKHKPTKASL